MLKNSWWTLRDHPSHLWTYNSFYWVKHSFYIKSKPSIILFVCPVKFSNIRNQERPRFLKNFWQLKERFSTSFQWEPLSDRLLHLRLFQGKQVAQVDLGVNVTRDLPLVEETRQVGLHFGASWHSHAQCKEATQVLLHKRKMVSIQTLLPSLLRPMAFLSTRRSH